MHIKNQLNENRRIYMKTRIVLIERNVSRCMRSIAKLVKIVSNIKKIAIMINFRHFKIRKVYRRDRHSNRIENH